MADSHDVPTLSDSRQIDSAALRMIRTKTGRTVRDVAAEVGISHPRLVQLENGTKITTTPYVVAKLATVLRVPACVITVAP